jgi:hypothetical protein
MGEINNAERAVISGSHPPMARSGHDAGRIPSATRLAGMSLVLKRSDEQETALQTLIAAQQSPSSPLYHQWLTPAAFAARFGMSDVDIEKIKSWLQQEGFAIDGVSRSKNRILFSGSVGQAETAFGTELHYYKTDSTTNFAPSQDVSVPAALSPVVETIANLSSFRPRPHVKLKSPQAARPNFTSSQSSSHYLTPGDVTTIYDVKAAYSAGYTGVGQSIAIVGQSSVELSDIENFQSAAGLTTKDPTTVLVPNSGTAAVSTNDEAESDLDLEYSGAIAKGATIYFVYVGNDTNYSTFDAIQYAVDTRIAPIISNSYGDCETDLGSADYSTLNGILAQAASQGQSVISAVGDSGSTDCYEDTNLTTEQRTALAVDFPGSSQYVTGMGGSEFPSADVSSSNTTYWESASGSDVISSALSYIPEQVWDDDSSSNGLSSGGGGVSTLTARPSWQTGVTGISSGSYRLVPDISLDASPNNAGFLYCSSDETATGISGSCTNGFRDSSNDYLTVAGGTSFDAPIFAGMLAIINQQQNSTGQGVVNSTLYTLAASSTTYASAFHDITSGGNTCSAGSTYCSSAGEADYSAGTGYDEASGLGSVDLYNLMTVWPSSTSASLAATTTTLSAADSTLAASTSETITITVAPQSIALSTTPSGTVSITVDGTTEANAPTLANGSATYSFASATAGVHVIEATYSGDSTYAASSGTITITVGASTTTSTETFTLAATNVAVAAGSSGSSTITVTPKNGYTGTIGWTVSADSSALTNACYSITNTAISSSTVVTAGLTIYTTASECSSASVTGASGSKRKMKSVAVSAFTDSGVAMAGLLCAGLLGYPFTRRRAGLAVLLAIGLLAVGCGSSGSTASSTSSSNASAGTYTLTITGTDTTSSTITASTTMTLTID